MQTTLKKNLLILSTLLILVLLGIGIVYYLNTTKETPAEPIVPMPIKEIEEPKVKTNIPIVYPQVTEPILTSRNRITLKPYGLYVSPGNSPVQNERFAGYHTGTDFETTDAERNVDVPIYAICPGKVLIARIVDGYGGVIIQSCSISQTAVTVLYGHLDLGSKYIPQVGKSLKAGERIAILGEVGTNTDGERKHLHLGIHKGPQIEYRGYVDERVELSDWLNISKYLTN